MLPLRPPSLRPPGGELAGVRSLAETDVELRPIVYGRSYRLQSFAAERRYERENNDNYIRLSGLEKEEPAKKR